MTFTVNAYPGHRQVSLRIPAEPIDQLLCDLAEGVVDHQSIRDALDNLADANRVIRQAEAMSGHEIELVSVGEYDRARDFRDAALKTLHAAIGHVEWFVPATQAQILAARIRETANEAGS